MMHLSDFVCSSSITDTFTNTMLLLDYLFKRNYCRIYNFYSALSFCPTVPNAQSDAAAFLFFFFCYLFSAPGGGLPLFPEIVLQYTQ